jgi:2-dehydro-3-deoxygluconokinase
MSYGLNLRSDGALDLLSLGALVHRLDPGVIPFRKATECQIHVSGGEFNVAANLSDCFGLKTGIASAMVDYPIGDLIAERVKAMGVQPFYKRFEHNGVTGPNMATVYSDRGQGVRAPVVFYNRCNEAAGLLKAGDFDWDAIMAGGVRWFHSGGIFAALSRTTSDVIIEGMQAARAHGAYGACGAAPMRPPGLCAASSRTLTCWSATRRTSRWGSVFPARRCTPRASSTRRPLWA